MAAEKTLKYLLVGEDRGATKALNQVGTAAALASTAMLVGIGKMAKSSVDAASDLGESVNAVNVTFGKSAEGIKTLGENAAEAMGLSNAEFNGLAVQFSSFANTVAGEGGDVVGVMEDLTGRSADFASVMNIDVAEAARVFQSGLAGETEPLKKFGIDLSAAAVNAYAYANGIAESGKKLTEQQKVQARYQLLMEQTNKTAGDFANTSDSMANRQRILNAEWENAQAKLGEALIPSMEKMLGIGQGIVEWMGENTGLVSALAGGTAVLSATTLTAVGTMKAWNTTQEVMGKLLGGNTAKLAKFNKALAAAGAAAAVVGVAVLADQLYDLMARAGVATVEVDELSKALDNLADGAEEVPELGDIFESGNALPMFRREIETTEDTLKAFADSAQMALGGGVDAVERFFGNGSVAKFEKQVSQLDDAFAAMVADGNIDGARKSFDAFTKAAEEQGVNIDDLTRMFPGYKSALEAASSATGGIESATGAAADAQDDYNEEMDEAISKINEQVDSLLDLLGVQREVAGIKLTALEAESAFQAAIDGVTDSVKENGQTLDLNTEAGRANQGALLAMAEAGWDSVESQVALDGSGKTARETMTRARDEFVKSARAMGMSKDEANALADELGLIPKNVNVAIQANATQAIAAAEATLRALGKIPDYKHVTIGGSLTSAFEAAYRTAANSSFVALPRAAGGPISGPGTSTSDSIPALLSNGEYVIRASSVQKYGRGFLDAVNTGRFSDGGYVGSGLGMGGPMELSDSSISRLASAILAGARVVADGSVSSSQRAAALAGSPV